MMRRSAALMSSVRVQDHGKTTRVVTLSREKALNALDLPMVEMLLPHYRGFHEVPKGSLAVIMKGAGSKAFCAGGDVVSLVKDEPKGVQRAFFYREYQLDYAVATLPHPHVALWNGIVMGGGVGVSAHGSHRVCTEAALFAMPETGIGLFPDVGGSWLLPRLPHAGLGMYLALTGQRLKGADVVHSGLGTHYVPRSGLEKLYAALQDVAPAAVADTVDELAQAKPSEPFTLEPHLRTIERCFGPQVPSVLAVLEALQADGSEWALKQHATLQRMSPASMVISFEAQRRAAKMTDIKQVFQMEYRMSQRCMATNDFKAGVTALLIEKTGKPVWSPATLADITPEFVESHFSHAPLEWHPTEPFPEDVLSSSL